jgi:anti-sigma regulatory factor (Ser/Thr protein kinase)
VTALDSEAAKKVLAHNDRDELVQLGCELTNIPSPTGHEKAIADSFWPGLRQMFEAGSPQSDDNRGYPAAAQNRIGTMADFVAELTAKPDVISALTERVAKFLAESGVDARAVHYVALVLDELLTNVVIYGGTIETPVSIRLTILPDRVTAEVLDGGMIFDPRVEQNLDVSTSVEERPVGGLGVVLVRR